MPEPIGQLFMEQTRYRYLGASDQQKGLPQPPLELAAPEGATWIALPDPARVVVPPLDLRQAIAGRQSVRRYAPLPLSPDELSYLLWCTQGVLEVGENRSYTRRTVPSAGARHALETYLLINRVEGMTPGLYRFMALEHSLVVVDLAPDIAARMTAACLGQDMVQTCGVTLVWVAVPERMVWCYGQRGYRYLHLDAGHVCQNLYLAAESVKCGVCAIAAFSDQDLCAVLGIDGVKLFPIYLATVGKKLQVVR